MSHNKHRQCLTPMFRRVPLFVSQLSNGWHLQIVRTPFCRTSRKSRENPVNTGLHRDFRIARTPFCKDGSIHANIDGFTAINQAPSDGAYPFLRLLINQQVIQCWLPLFTGSHVPLFVERVPLFVRSVPLFARCVPLFARCVPLFAETRTLFCEALYFFP